MDRLAKQIVQIANEIAEIEKMDEMETKVASIRVAGFFSKLFSKGMNEENKEQCQQVVELLDGQQTMAMLMRGDIKSLDSLMQPLKKTKELNLVYDKFMKFFKQVYDSFPKSVLNKAKDINENDLLKQIKEDKKLQEVAKQFNKAMDILKKDLQTIKSQTGFATDSWQDAFKGWGGIDFGE